MYTGKHISALAAIAWTLLHGVTAIPAVSVNITIPSSTELSSSVVVASSRPVFESSTVFGVPAASPSLPGVALSSAPSSIHISASASTPISVSTPSFQFSFAPIIVTHSILPETSPFTLLAPSCPTPVCPACPPAAAASTVTVTVTETRAAAATTAAAIAAIGATTQAAAASTTHTTAPAFSFSSAVESTTRAVLPSVVIPTAPAFSFSSAVESTTRALLSSVVIPTAPAASVAVSSSVRVSAVAVSAVGASGVAASSVAGGTSTSIALLSSVVRPSSSVSVSVTPSLPIIPFATGSPTSSSAIVGTASTTLGTTTTSGTAITATSATIASTSLATASPAAGLPRRSLSMRGNFTVPLKARLEPMIFRPRGQ